jgi:ATP-dependent DNA helicase RecG
LDAEPISEKDVKGPLPDAIEGALTFFKLNLPQRTEYRDGIVREEIYICPMEAIREAIVNAVCHRDYTIAGSAIRSFVFEDRIEVRSPGGMPNTLTIESLRYRQHARNQTIASYLAGFGYMEQRGKGIPKMQKLAERAGHRFEISLTDDGQEFVVMIAYGKRV